MKNKIISKGILLALIFGLALDATPVLALTKEETIYSKLNSDGSVNSTTVSEHLYNYDGKSVSDKSNLNNINSNGTTYNSTGDKLVWETNGSDIYYQGKTSKSLPISLDVHYYLNGHEMNVKDMIGESGKVKIVINYKNNLYTYKFINGRNEIVYTPFVIATTSIINNTDNNNIKVSNGKVIDNGVVSMVVAVSSPGLYETLGVDELKNMNTVEISYNTNSFELNSIYSVATSKVLDNSDFDVFNSMNTLFSSISQLQDNMNIIVDAANKLRDGSKELANGTNELNNKINEITNKYYSYRNKDQEELKNEISKAIKEALKDVIPELEEDVSNELEDIIKENKQDLEQSAIEFTKTNVKLIIQNEMNNILNNIDINALMNDIVNNSIKNTIINDEYVNSLTTLLKEELNNSIRNEIKTMTTNTFNATLANMSISMTQEEYVAYVNGIAQAYGVTFEQANGIVSKVQQDTVLGIKQKLGSSIDTISNNISDQVINNLNNKDYIGNLIGNYVQQVSIKINTAMQNNPQLVEARNQFKLKILNAFNEELNSERIYLGNISVKEYVNGILNNIINTTSNDLAKKYTEDYANQVVDRVLNKQFNQNNVNNKVDSALNKYEKDIKDKLNILDDTVNKLSNAINQVNNGNNAIANGMDVLSNGLNKYNNEGINKLNQIVNGDIKSISSKLEAMIELSNQYKTLDDISDNTEGSSRMVFLIDSVKKEKEKKVNDEKIVEKKTFWQKIKGLFE